MSDAQQSSSGWDGVAADVSSGANNAREVEKNSRARLRGPARDMRSQAYRRFIDDERPIVAVTRRRFDVVTINHGHDPRFVTISLPRVARYFEEEKP
jgi:hypothetical protein